MPLSRMVVVERVRTRARRHAAGALALLAALAVLAGAPSDAGALVLAPPVSGPVLDGFDAPTRYGPGHRGVDLAAPPGTPVRAPAPGTVTFAGQVVDAAWVTVDHGAVRTTVGPLAEVVVRRGQLVARGTVLGTSGRAHGTAAVHWSLRRGDTYLDPLAVNRTGARRVATLLPDRAARGVPTQVHSPRAWSRLLVR